MLDEADSVMPAADGFDHFALESREAIHQRGTPRTSRAEFRTTRAARPRPVAGKG